jgi:hypothetical protein
MVRRVPKRVPIKTKPKPPPEKPNTFLAMTQAQADSFVGTLENLREDDKEQFDKSVLGQIYEAMIRGSK